MKNLRTVEGQARYDEYRRTLRTDSCVICERAPIAEFVYWKIIPNHFPYDRIAERHDMLVPKRHITEGELTDAEYEEMLAIKSKELAPYNYIIQATPDNRSIPAHLHFHLITAKPIA